MKTNQPKNVQKSIRISEDVAKYIEKQEGNGFNEKLCNMVLYCMEHEADIRKKISAAENRLESVEKRNNVPGNRAIVRNELQKIFLRKKKLGFFALGQNCNTPHQIILDRVGKSRRIGKMSIKIFVGIFEIPTESCVSWIARFYQDTGYFLSLQRKKL